METRGYRWPNCSPSGGDPSDGRIDFEGELTGVHYIGHGMSTGAIHVHGDAGRHVGGQMTGGRIEIEGNAGDWLGAEMRGGVIQVAGDAGDSIGAAYRGSKKGTTDGTILIRGDVGKRSRYAIAARNSGGGRLVRRRPGFQHDRGEHRHLRIVW